MQSYTPISTTDTLANGPGVINQNDQTILSCNSGTAYPTTNLQVGMLCYRTDQKKLYQLTDATASTWVLLLDLSTGAANAGGLMSGGTAWQVATGQGPAWGAAIPRIGSDGGCEIGQYLDFHAVTNDNQDNAVRLTGASGKLTCSGAFASNELLVQPATGAATVVLNGATTAQASTFYQWAGVNKWQSGLNGDGSWFLYDAVGGRFNIIATPSTLELGGAQNLTLPPGGGATLNNGALTVANGITAYSLTTNARIQSLGLGTIGQFECPAGSGSSWYNAAIRNDGYAVYFLSSSAQTTLAAAQSATFNNLRPFSWNLGSGSVNIDGTGAGSNFGGNVSMPSFTVTSDRRLKTDIAPLSGHGELIDATNVYTYTKNGRRQWGVIAQELQASAPELVHEGQDGLLEVDYMSLFAALLAEVRSLRQDVATLKAE